MSKPFVVACIPALNEENTIAGIILLTKKYVDQVVICDDGSVDMTYEIAGAMATHVIKHKKNRGKGAALKSALKQAMAIKANIVVTLDADGQHDPNEIPRLIQPIINQEADITIGSRYMEGSANNAPAYRKLGLSIINALSRIKGKNSVKDTQSGFRAFSEKAFKVILDSSSNGFGIETEQLSIGVKQELRIVEIPVNIRYTGLYKTSKKDPLSHGIEIIITALRLISEEKPIQYIGLPGTLLTLIGISTGIYFLWLFNTTKYFSIPGALITLGLLVLGIFLILTSIILYSINRMNEKKH
jgi:glycosyltransferase involved in cell wall biosynthesis